MLHVRIFFIKMSITIKKGIFNGRMITVSRRTDKCPAGIGMLRIGIDRAITEHIII